MKRLPGKTELSCGPATVCLQHFAEMNKIYSAVPTAPGFPACPGAGLPTACTRAGSARAGGTGHPHSKHMGSGQKQATSQPSAELQVYLPIKGTATLTARQRAAQPACPRAGWGGEQAASMQAGEAFPLIGSKFTRC